LDDLLAQAAHYAEFCLRSSGTMAPTLFLIGAEGPMMMVPDKFSDSNSKYDFATTARLIEADRIECVLGLGLNLFYNPPKEASVVICRTAKPKARRGKILLINAVNEVTRERAQSFLTDGHIEHIVHAYEQFADTPGFARVVTLAEVRAKDGNLSIPLNVTPAIEAQLNDRQKKIITQVAKTGLVTSGWCGKSFGVALLTVQRDLAALVDFGLIERKGQGRGARYVLTGNR